MLFLGVDQYEVMAVRIIEGIRQLTHPIEATSIFLKLP
jgi:hypothetical protein